MTRPPREYLVLYDIASADRLAHVRSIVRAWGDRLQYSVYRCILSDRQMAALVDKLCDAIHHGEDQVAFIDLGSTESERTTRVKTLGLPPVAAERRARIV